MRYLNLLIFGRILLLVACSFAGYGCTSHVNEADMPLSALQEKIRTLVFADQYDQAIDLLNSLDLASYVPASRSAAIESRPQYWAVMEDGVSLPYLWEIDLPISEAIQIKEDAWILPGTSDSQSFGAETRWQNAAKKQAKRFNQLLYESINQTDSTETK